MHSFQLDFVPPSTPETRPVIMNNYQQQQPQTSNSGESSTQPPPPPPQTYQLVPITMNGPPPLPPGAATLPPDYPKGSFNHPIPIHLPPGYHLVPQPAHLPPPQHGEDVRVYLAAAAAAGDQDKGDQQQQRVAYYASAAELYSHVQANVPPRSGSHEPEEGGIGANHYPAVTSSAAQGSAQPQEQSPSRLPPILQVEKVQVTTNATQAASASRRRNDANFACPVPGCGSTFTRRFNLRGHLRSHTEERPYVCSWPNCQKGFARQHDCKSVLSAFFIYTVRIPKQMEHLQETSSPAYSQEPGKCVSRLQ